MLAQFPAGGAVTQGLLAGDAAEYPDARLDDIVLLIPGQRGRRLVHVAVVSDLEAAVEYVLDHIFVGLGHKTGDIEAGWDGVSFQHV